MNKRAAIFALGITVVVFIVCSYALFKFIIAKTGVADMFNSPAKILEMNLEKEKFEFFAEESAKLAISQAYQQIADAGKFAGSECTIESGYLNFCSLGKDSDATFSSLIQEEINKFVLSYSNADFNKISYKVSIKDKTISFDSEKKQLKGSAEGTFAYSFTYDFQPSFFLSLDDLNLNSFQEIFAKAAECKGKEKTEDVANCMNELQFNAAIKKSDGKTFFDLTSKKRFFIDDSYKSIILKFSY